MRGAGSGRRAGEEDGGGRPQHETSHRHARALFIVWGGAVCAGQGGQMGVRGYLRLLACGCCRSADRCQHVKSGVPICTALPTVLARRPAESGQRVAGRGCSVYGT